MASTRSKARWLSYLTLFSGALILFLVLHSFPNGPWPWPIERGELTRSLPRHLEASKAPIAKASHPVVRDSAPGRIDQDQGRLSLDVVDQPLGSVVRALHRQTSIRITLAEEIRHLPVTAHLEALPIEQGLRQLLQGFDTYFLFNGNSDGASLLTSVWVFPQGAGHDAQWVPRQKSARRTGRPSDASPRASETPDARPRAGLTATRISQAGNDAPLLLETALADPDEQVRMEALQNAGLAGVDLDPSLLESLFRQDPSSTVRAMALSALSSRGDDPDALVDVPALLHEALMDPSDEVADFAQQLLDAMSDVPEAIPDTAPQWTAAGTAGE